MGTESVRGEHRVKHRYTFVVVPDAKSEKTRTFSLTRWGLVGTFAAALVVVIALILAFIVYTPVGTLLPMAQSELAKQYGKQILDVQRQLSTLAQEMTVLRKYNVQLRKAMGEKLPLEGEGRNPSAGAGRESLMAASGTVARETRARMESEGMQSARQQEGPALTSEAPVHDAGAMPSQLPLVVPTEGYVSRGFDPEQFHFGIDIAAKAGSPVVAAADGRVMFAGWTYDDGYMLILSHELGYATVYKHNQSLLKNAGDAVRRGELVALLGNTGKTSSNPHLHFELWKDGIVQDPNNFLLSIP
jgi:murein DD-endopeptidase MepM/ murein hydrolase activator NlpD